jgi:hypothetical protein
VIIFDGNTSGGDMMKKAWLFFLVISGWMLIPVTGYVQDNLVKDTAEFDRAYIPALFLTGQAKMEQSQRAMGFLKEGWAKYKMKYYDLQPKDPKWMQNMDKAEDYIKAADTWVAGGGDLTKAHEELEGVRELLMEARRRNKIDYFPDYLSEFHHYMEEIFDAADKKKPETLGDQDIDAIKKVLPSAVTSWEAAKTARFDAQAFGFDPEKVQKMGQLHKAVEDTLLSLQEALGKGDKAEIIKNATSLKGKFVQVYLLFGDFERLKK